MHSMLQIGSAFDAPRWGAATVALATSLLTGCGGPPIGPEICDRPEAEDPIDYAGGEVEGAVYRTADWDGELLHFPGGAFYRIHHGLDQEPRWWNIYLSFERFGLEEGSLAQAAGNQAEVKAVDDETITIVNASCVEYYMLTVVGL